MINDLAVGNDKALRLCLQCIKNPVYSYDASLAFRSAWYTNSCEVGADIRPNECGRGGMGSSKPAAFLPKPGSSVRL